MFDNIQLQNTSKPINTRFDIIPSYLRNESLDNLIEKLERVDKLSIDVEDSRVLKEIFFYTNDPKNPNETLDYNNISILFEAMYNNFKTDSEFLNVTRSQYARFCCEILQPFKEILPNGNYNLWNNFLISNTK